jgi:hypothetical protein
MVPRAQGRHIMLSADAKKVSPSRSRGIKWHVEEGIWHLAFAYGMDESIPPQ